MKSMNDARTAFKRILVTSLMLLIASVAYVLISFAAFPKVFAGMSLDEFASKANGLKELFLVDGQEGSKLIWVGPIKTWTLPSGPPCYVFDSNMKLIRWTISTGEGSPVDQDFREAQSIGRKVHLSDAVKCLNSSVSPKTEK